MVNVAELSGPLSHAPCTTATRPGHQTLRTCTLLAGLNGARQWANRAALCTTGKFPTAAGAHLYRWAGGTRSWSRAWLLLLTDSQMQGPGHKQLLQRALPHQRHHSTGQLQYIRGLCALCFLPVRAAFLGWDWRSRHPCLHVCAQVPWHPLQWLRPPPPPRRPSWCVGFLGRAHPWSMHRA